MNSISKSQYIHNKSYKLPNILHSHEDLLRFHDEDLKDMDDFALSQEQLRVIAALANVDTRKQLWMLAGPGKYVSAIDWLSDRNAAIESEQARRIICQP